MDEGQWPGDLRHVGQPVPELNYPQTFMPDNTKLPMGHPRMDVTGPVPVTPASATLPVELLLQQQKQADAPAVTPAANPAAGSASPQTAPDSQPAPAAPQAGPDAGGIQK